MNNITSQTHNSEHSGFVLLFSLVVSAIIFLIGAGIFSLSFKELLTSSIAQESQKSIFAADSGVECALAADTKSSSFNGELNSFECFGETINPSFTTAGVYVFNIGFRDNSTCSIVQVDTTDPEIVSIISQGYNKCNGDEPLTNYPGLALRVYRVSFFR